MNIIEKLDKLDDLVTILRAEIPGLQPVVDLIEDIRLDALILQLCVVDLTDKDIDDLGDRQCDECRDWYIADESGKCPHCGTKE